MSLILKNGVLVGSSNLTVTIGGVILTGIKSISFKTSQKKENVYGFQSEPVGRGRGMVEYPNGTMEILLEEYKAIVAAAPNRNIKQIGMFNIPIVYDNLALGKEVLNNCEFVGSDHGYKAGDTALWISVEFIFAGING